MWEIIIVAALGFLIGAADGYDPAEAIGLGILGAIFGAIVGFLVALFIGMFVYTDTKWEVTQTTQLINIGDNLGVEGRFFLGSGSIDSEPVYLWYEKSGSNSFVRKTADAEGSTIHYTDKRPYYTITKEKSAEKGFVHPWGMNTNGAYGVKYDFYVPKGSIAQEYVLDNK